MEYILIGKIVNTHGINGSLKVEIYTDFIKERFMKGSKIYIKSKNEYLEFEVNSANMHKNNLLITLKDHLNINLVEKYKGLEIYKNKADIKPLKDGYYFSDLKDLDIIVDDKIIGKVLYVEEGLAHNNLRVKVDDKEVLIPFVKAFIKEVDLNKHYIIINYMEGLF